jgi:hypothetical protein
VQILKDLTEDLQKALANNHTYSVELEIVKLLAGRDVSRTYTYSKESWGSVSRTESHSKGTPLSLTAPSKRRKIRKGEEDIKTVPCHTFRIVNERILIPWGGRFGVFKRSLERSLQAQGRMRYDITPLDLIQVYPVWIDAGKAPPDSVAKGTPELVLERRNTRNNVMVEVFYDFIEHRDVSFFLRIDGECPINEEKLVALVSTLNSLDCVGPSLRGRLKVKSVKQVKLDPEELESNSISMETKGS